MANMGDEPTFFIVGGDEIEEEGEKVIEDDPQSGYPSA